MATINIRIIERNITGTASSSEQEILHAWLLRDKANRDAYFRMKNIWDSSRIGSHTQEDIRREWQMFVGRRNKPEPVRRRPFVRTWMHYAAVISVMAGLTWVVMTLSHSEPPAPEPVTWQQIVVPNGQRTQIILSDGSRVSLNSGTTLRYPSDFGIRNRQLTLSGEADFEVTASNIPFTVSTDSVEITVLGTHFNVRNYNTDNEVETTLVEGSVSLKTPANELLMKPGDVAVYRKSQQTTSVRQTANVANKLAWTDNHLIIDGERLDNIARMLERRYNVRIIIDDEHLKDYRYTGKFIYNESLMQVLKVIGATTPLRYRKKGDEIIISKK